MAEFAPEVGMDIGASNVRPQSGPSVDFSAVGKFVGSIFDQGSDKTPTESSLKKAALDPIIADGSRIAQVEDPMQKKVLMDIWFTRAMASAGSNYRTDIEAIYKDYTGIESPSVNSEVAIRSSIVSDFASTDEGKAVIPFLINEAKDETGNVNQAYLEALMFDEATTVASRKATNERVKTDLETGKTTQNTAFYGTFTPSGQRQGGLVQGYLTDFNKDVQRLTSSTSVNALMQDLQQNKENPEYNAEALLRTVAEIEQSRDTLMAKVTQEMVAFGFDMSDAGVKASLEGLSNNHNILINTLKTKPTFIVNLAKTLEEKAKLVEKSNTLFSTQAEYKSNTELVKRFGPIALVPEFKEGLVLRGIAVIPDVDIQNYIKDQVVGGDKSFVPFFDTPTFLGGSGFVTPRIPQEGGQSSAVETPAPSVPWDEGALKQFSSYTPEQVEATVKSAGYIMKATPTLDKRDIRESVDTQSAAFLAGFANRTAKYLTPDQMVGFVNDDMVAYFGRVGADAPDLLPNLLEQADAFMESEVSKNIEPLATMVKNISGQNNSIFDFNFDPQARVLTATVSDRAYAQLTWVKAAVDMSGSRDSVKVMEAASKSGNAIPFRGAADLKEFRDNMSNITYILATINKLPPDQQKKFTKTVNTIESSLASMSKTQPIPATTLLGEAGVAAGKLPKVVQDNLPTLREIFSLQDSLSNVDNMEEERAILSKIETLKESVPQEALNLSANDITNIKINTRKTESSERTSELNRKQPRRIKWSEVVQDGMGAGR